MPLRRSVLTNTFVTLLISIATSVLLFGCGGGEKTEAAKAEESVGKKFGEEGLVKAQVVVRAYEQGRLGTREQVEASMEPFFSPSDYETKIPKPFDSSGKFIPLSELNDEQIFAFSQWYTSDRVYPIVRDEMNAAIVEFRAKRDSKD